MKSSPMDEIKIMMFNKYVKQDSTNENRNPPTENRIPPSRTGIHQ
jgi:hypothetical protein